MQSSSIALKIPCARTIHSSLIYHLFAAVGSHEGQFCPSFQNPAYISSLFTCVTTNEAPGSMGRGAGETPRGDMGERTESWLVDLFRHQWG